MTVGRQLLDTANDCTILGRCRPRERRYDPSLPEMEQPPLLADLREFVTLHRAHGELRAVASPPTPNGYRLEVACPCHVVFERWVVPDDAAIDMALLARWN